MPLFYLIGSLRNPEVPKIAAQLRDAGFDIFDDWYAAGPIADDSWRDYEIERGRTYVEALKGLAAKHVFEFDLTHLSRADGAVLVLPAGKSSHLELGWMLGRNKRGFVLLDKPDRWDVMMCFATGVYSTVDELIAGMEMPYVQKAGEAPKLVEPYVKSTLVPTLVPANVPISLSTWQSAPTWCYTCGKPMIGDHTRCRGAA